MRATAWTAVVALVVLAARALAYALSPSPLAAALQHQAGGPALPVVALVSGALGLGVACAILWLAALGVGERSQLEGTPRPRLGLRRAATHAAALCVVSCLAFALLESTLHWRAGLGWHGLACLTGPVHRDAIPLLAALSLIAAAVAAALDHVVAWMRRTLARLRARPPRRRPARARAPRATAFPTRPHSAHGARGPPLLAG